MTRQDACKRVQNFLQDTLESLLDNLAPLVIVAILATFLFFFHEVIP